MIRLESQHDLSFPRAAVWPVLSQTDWLNRSLGLPPVDYDIAPRSEGGSTVTGRTRLLGQEMRWREFPFEWVEPEFYRVHRIFENGPFTEARLGMDLQELPDGKTRLIAYSELTPRHAFGGWLAKFILGPKARRDMRSIAIHTEEYLRKRTKTILPRLPVHPVNASALQAGLQKLRATESPAEMTRHLEQFLHESPDVELARIRPLALARRWNQDSWETLRLCLHATRSGLLDLSWEILCPNCRSSRQPPAGSLRQLSRTSHCEVCQIEFNAEFDKSVELKFAVNPSIRPREAQTFCLAGPGGKPHVVSQLWLEPQEERSWKIPASACPLRLRSPQVPGNLVLSPEDLVAQERPLYIFCQPTGWQLQPEPKAKPDGLARFVNPNPFPILVTCERMAWSDEILTAARVTNWQEFRDLFTSEIISPAEQITVGSQVILFTDLRGSTAMYHGLGDAPAYALVRNHFSVLAEAIRAHHGTVVKTIGDAVMATFSRADEALGAVRQMHENLPEANPNLAAPLALKSSLHLGPCLAVNANDKLDFFGTTINLAARMVECCHGGDLTVSDEFFQRPETGQFLQTFPKSHEASEVQFRGFSTPHRVWRIKMV